MLIRALITIIVSIIIMSAISWQLTLVLLASIVPPLLGAVCYARA
jgi:ABC-type bacteriocin/lantibiotic exporter with double-glycine peptidase domain